MASKERSPQAWIVLIRYAAPNDDLVRTIYGPFPTWDAASYWAGEATRGSRSGMYNIQQMSKPYKLKGEVAP